MTAPKCIHCGKPIKKEVHIIWFSRAFVENGPGKQEGDIERSRISTTVYTNTMITTKEEVQRFTNNEIISVKRGAKGEIYAAGTWDGTSYESKFFHSQGCAAAFGLAAA